MTAQLPVAIEELTPKQGEMVYLAEQGLQPYFDYIKAEAANEVPDLTTLKGRKRIASLAAKVASSKKAVEAPGREYLKQLKAQPKIVETNLREFVNSCNELRDQVRKPLTQWEEEQKRIAEELQARVDYFNEEYSAAVEALATTPLHEKVTLIKSVIEAIEEEVVDESFGERQEDAQKLKAEVLEKLSLLATGAIVEIDNQRRAAEEEDRKRVIRENQIALEAQEKAKAEAEAKAKAELEAAERKAQEEKAAIERKAEEEKQALIAEQQRKEAEIKRQAELAEQEKARQEAQAKAEEEAKRQEELARQQNIEHRKAVNNEILNNLKALGVEEQLGKAIITAAARNQLGKMVINY
ncbi:hypothetical protein JQC92_02510 [Shewanella sp. 202IG2-18]|uniref:hypothetical protein n=1 Tax=Parashewanella hymeniacidonis TaxID=2807618 RepID=UPI001961FB0E|nr:hypothetical protein [Parashewanella hymeniacidonis]MBM7070914.1 hypothetical protein [Parashewanella hymeniacidonis]